MAPVWPAHSEAPQLARILRSSGMFWAIWLTLCFVILSVLTVQCAGNWLYGFADCTVFSDRLARRLTGISLLSFAAGIAYGVILLVGGGIWELVVRARN